MQPLDAQGCLAVFHLRCSSHFYHCPGAEALTQCGLLCACCVLTLSNCDESSLAGQHPLLVNPCHMMAPDVQHVSPFNATPSPCTHSCTPSGSLGCYPFHEICSH